MKQCFKNRKVFELKKNYLRFRSRINYPITVKLDRNDDGFDPIFKTLKRERGRKSGVSEEKSEQILLDFVSNCRLVLGVEGGAQAYRKAPKLWAHVNRIYCYPYFALSRLSQLHVCHSHSYF